MYLPRHDTLYIHQRKTAGMSIGFALGLSPDDPDWHVGNDGVLDQTYWDAVQRWETYVFSSVRNPFDRAVSGWRYLNSTKGRRFEEVLLEPPTEGADYRHFTRPQSAILVDPDSNELVVDDLIRYESLQADFRRITAMRGIPTARLRRRNRTWHRTYRSYYSREARELVETLFADDLERFNYAF
jgi:hypothetical protein